MWKLSKINGETWTSDVDMTATTHQWNPYINCTRWTTVDIKQYVFFIYIVLDSRKAVGINLFQWWNWLIFKYQARSSRKHTYSSYGNMVWWVKLISMRFPTMNTIVIHLPMNHTIFRYHQILFIRQYILVGIMKICQIVSVSWPKVTWH